MSGGTETVLGVPASGSRMGAILAAVRTVPTLSDVVSRVHVLMNDPRSSAADFERVIRTDPGLTTNLLRLANSAFFGVGREVVSVRQAVTVLGTRRVFDLAAAVSFMAVLPGRLPGYDLDARAMWRHCVAVALLGESLAGSVGFGRPDLLFTAGLLHDVGKLVISTFLANQREELERRLRGGGMALPAAERDVLGTDHADIGAAIAVRWQLPSSIAAAARWHHDPDAAPKETDRALVDLVHAANGLAHMLGFGADVAGLQRPLSAAACERLGVTAEQLEAVACDSLEPIEQMAGLVGGETVSP